MSDPCIVSMPSGVETSLGGHDNRWLDSGKPVGLADAAMRRIIKALTASAPRCAVHPETHLVCPRCEQGRRGRTPSEAKARAARANGQLGGRPRQATARDPGN